MEPCEERCPATCAEPSHGSVLPVRSTALPALILFEQSVGLAFQLHATTGTGERPSHEMPDAGAHPGGAHCDTRAAAAPMARSFMGFPFGPPAPGRRRRADRRGRWAKCRQTVRCVRASHRLTAT